MGLFACTIATADENKTLAKLKDAEAKVAYALKMLRDRLTKCPPHELRIWLDGKEVFGEYSAFIGSKLTADRPVRLFW